MSWFWCCCTSSSSSPSSSSSSTPIECANSFCRCGNRCFPPFQFKFSGSVNIITGPGCTYCSDLAGVWYQYECDVDGVGFNQPSSVTGEDGLWYENGILGSIDPCTGLGPSVSYFIKIVQSGTTTTISIVLQESSGEWIRFDWDFTVTSGQCPDSSDTVTEVSPTTTTYNSDSSRICDFSSTTAVFRWV